MVPCCCSRQDALDVTWSSLGRLATKLRCAGPLLVAGEIWIFRAMHFNIPDNLLCLCLSASGIMGKDVVNVFSPSGHGLR